MGRFPACGGRFLMARPKSVCSVVKAVDVAINAAEVATAACLDVTATVAGLQPDFPVHVWAESLTTNLGICNAHCSALNTLKFRLINPSGGGINPDSLTFRVVQR
jgi:hypothetical protein